MIAGMIMALNAPRANPIQRAINILITESGDGLATEAGTYITLE
jgi:hypothetical protein